MLPDDDRPVRARRKARNFGSRIAASEVPSVSHCGGQIWGRNLTKSRQDGTPPRRAGAEDIEIGRKLRALRLERGLSQSRLARAIGLSFQQLQKYESGANRISAGRLQQVADHLGVPVAVFYGSAGGRAKRDEAGAFAYLQARGAVRLARAYADISSGPAKKALLVLVEALRGK